MSISIVFNGLTYTIPQTGDESWGENLTSYFTAIPQGALQKSAGTFTLTADVNFGPNFGVLSKYFSTRSASPSTAGLLRLALADTIGWKNNAQDGNLLLAINGSDQLTFNGTAIYPAGITALTGDVTATGPGSAAATIAAIQGKTVSGTTGTVNVVFSASPTVTGTVTAAAITMSGILTVNNATGINLQNGSGVTVGNITNDSGYFSFASNATNALGAKIETNGIAALTINNTQDIICASTVTIQNGSNVNIGSFANDTGFFALQSDASNASGIKLKTLGTTALSINNSQVINIPGLTASQAVVTDGSKNIASLGYASANTAFTLVLRDGSGNLSAGTVTAALTGTASGNTTYTPNNHGVVISGAANAMTVIAPDASTSKVFVSGGASASPVWSLLTNSNLSGSAAITNANLANMASASITVGTVKGNISGSAATPSDLILTSANTASSVPYRDASGNFSAGTITASLTGTATNATNAATVSTSTSASFFPLFVASSSNGNQAFNLGTGFTFNPSTNTLGLAILAASGQISSSKASAASLSDTGASLKLYDSGLGAGLFGQQLSGSPFAFQLQVADTTLAAQFPLSLNPLGGNVNIGAAGSTINIPSLFGVGSRAVNADAAGNLSAASDSRLKKEVKEASIPGLKEILQMTPRAYKWLKDIERRGDLAAVEIGFFADEVAPILPSAAPMGHDGLYGFYDRSVVAALVRAVQELKAEINELKER